MHGLDARVASIVRRAEVHGLPVEGDRARVGDVHTADAADQRRLTGAVVADDGGDLAAARVHRHTLERPDLTERQCGAVDLEQSVVGHVLGKRAVCGGLGHFWNLVRKAAATTTMPTDSG